MTLELPMPGPVEVRACAPPVVMSLAGVPAIGLPGPIVQYSGARLAECVMEALQDAGLRIQLPES
ncbi:hypothetical protein [Mycobacteroides chelonae]|nr:hypothetical protein [Mycobacteroides chelonae]